MKRIVFSDEAKAEIRAITVTGLYSLLEFDVEPRLGKRAFRNTESTKNGLESVTGNLENILSFGQPAQAEASTLIRSGTKNFCIWFGFADFH